MLIKKLYMEAASKSCLSQLKKYLAISNQRNTAIKSAQAIFLHALQALNSSLPLLRTTSTYTTIQPKVQTLFIISWFSIYFINKKYAMYFNDFNIYIAGFLWQFKILGLK